LILKKSATVKSLIYDGLRIIEAVGVPIDDLTPRRLEKMSMAFLALCSITNRNQWINVASISTDHILGTRQIIRFINKSFEESISEGSYDDIRRKDLIRLVGMGLIVKSAKNPEADNNDGTRGYALSNEFAELIKHYNSDAWETMKNAFEIDQDYIDKFVGKREKTKLQVKINEAVVVELDDGPHNLIQKAIIDEFLPIYGYGATVLYIGDASEKQLHKYADRMSEIGLDVQDRGMLPDIIAFSEEKQWVYLIEAVHSSNPLNPERCIELQRTVLKNCTYGVVFVTAFLSKKDFSKWMPQIAWETEVWLADSPEHLIHFNGDRFLGPHLHAPNL